MKTVTVLPAPALLYKPKVKNHLVRGVIHLTSQKFSIFVSAIAALIEYIGVLVDDERLIAYGAIVFVVGFTPWSIREVFLDIRQEKLGLHNDKW